MRRRLLVLPLAVLLAGPAFAATDEGELQRKDTVRDAVAAPLEDLNLKQKAIPAVLRRAVEAPYAMDGLQRCEAIAAEIGRLDAALGPDLDEAPPPDRRTKAQKLGGKAKDAAVGEVRHRAQDLIPFRGWVRKLTGAERHDKAIAAAIRAGSIRRGYLKGAGMDRNCAPPAAPSWFVPKKELTGFAALWAGIVAWVQSWWPF